MYRRLQVFPFNKQIKNLNFTSASSWCSINSLGERPWRLHSLDFTMMGTCPNDCLIIPLGTPLTDQLTSVCVHKHKGNKEGLMAAKQACGDILVYCAIHQPVLPLAFLCMCTSFLYTQQDRHGDPCRFLLWPRRGCV